VVEKSRDRSCTTAREPCFCRTMLRISQSSIPSRSNSSRALGIGAGAELHLQFNVFYFVESDVKVGYAHGFQATGIDQIYVVAAASF
jgi:hypothetical protein